MMQRRAVTLLHVGTLLFAPLICASMVGPAHAAERGARVAILPEPHGHAEPSDVFESVAKRPRLHLGLDLVQRNQLVVEGTEPLADAVRACASDERCLGQALASHEIDVGLRAMVNFAIDPPLVSLAVVNAAPARVLAESIVELPKGAGATERDAISASLSSLASSSALAARESTIPDARPPAEALPPNLPRGPFRASRPLRQKRAARPHPIRRRPIRQTWLGWPRPLRPSPRTSETPSDAREGGVAYSCSALSCSQALPPSPPPRGSM